MTGSPARRAWIGPRIRLTVVAAAIILAFIVGPEAGYTLIAAAVLAALATDGAELLAAVGLAVLGRAALAAGLFNFEPPVQVVGLLTSTVDPTSLIAENDIWWPRYLFTYPAAIGMDLGGYRLDRTFALYSAALVPLEAATLFGAARCALRRSGRPDRRRELVCLALIVVLTFGLASRMNGRLLVAYIGVGIVLAAQAAASARGRFTPALGGLVAVGALFGQMSTGVGAIAAAQAVVGSLIAVWDRPLARAETLRALVMASGLAGPFLYRSELKNFLFFGGDAGAIGGLLSHGAGGYLAERPAVLAAVILALLIVGYGVVHAYRRGWADRIPAGLRPAAAGVPIALAGGLFGFSTLTMVFPPLFVLLAAAAALAVEGATAR